LKILKKKEIETNVSIILKKTEFTAQLINLIFFREKKSPYPPLLTKQVFNLTLSKHNRNFNTTMSTMTAPTPIYIKIIGH